MQTCTGQGFAQTRLALGSATATTFDIYYDDAAIDDAAYPGAGQVNILKPNATGTTSAWTNGAGTSPTNVAEVPHNSDTGYITSSTSGNVTTVNLDSSATGGVSGAVAAAKVIGIVRDEGGASSLSIRAKSGATNSDTTAVDPGASYTALAKILTTDPNTSAAWTTSGLDALEIGVVNSANVAVRCTALYAMVECAPSTIVTLDVAEDAALSTTGTKDISSDAATTAPATKDVATAAATTAVVTLDLAEAAAITTTNTKDVAEDAAIQTTNTKDVATAGVVTTTNTKDVTEDAILTTTGTKDIASDAVITAGTTVTLDLAEAAAVSVSLTSDGTPTLYTYVYRSTGQVGNDVAENAALSVAATKDLLMDASVGIFRAEVATAGVISMTATADLTFAGCISVGVTKAPGSGTATVSRLTGGRASTTRLTGGRARDTRPRGGGSANLGP